MPDCAPLSKPKTCSGKRAAFLLPRNQAEKGHPIFSCVGNFPVPRARKTSCARIYFLHAKGWKKTGENHHILLTSIFIGVSIGLIAKWRTLSQNYC
ncbi:hypothetical protein [Akkermansia muciniphila]|uniref:hypothetical protein n=1 Tax=Akkermansia muciniphila TaxID=239935 RepID=UPI000A72FB51|nr:hypothetical protein [Akkermansia muciniphila]KAA3384619.1 hypothetical protein F1909_11340 [Akkermansia muciniphila]KAA3405156.1 hypothetical protein F1904_11360 [Akkermansia muciniphila]MBS5975944.1 hypothetical protein [Akkermansia muciniphila]MCG4696519.1 hypothetical protein [Akkermansia muciniphila]MCL6686306.1 hypothetical protein [Akkermansia muciniphila]